MWHDSHQGTVLGRGKKPARWGGVVAVWNKEKKRRMGKAYISKCY